MCSKCDVGYLLIGSVCVKHQGCLNVTEDGYCITCKEEGYYLEKGKCQKCPEGCKTCKNSSHCDACMVSYGA